MAVEGDAHTMTVYEFMDRDQRDKEKMMSSHASEGAERIWARK